MFAIIGKTGRDGMLMSIRLCGSSSMCGSREIRCACTVTFRHSRER
jgi:hypothetical protein